MAGSVTNIASHSRVGSGTIRHSSQFTASSGKDGGRLTSATKNARSITGPAPSSTRPHSGDSSLGEARGGSPLPGAGAGELQSNGPHYADPKDDRLELKHGLQKDFVLKLGGHIKTVLYYPRNKSCTVLFSGGINRYVEEELDQEFQDSSVTDDVDKLLHASDLGVYVGVCKAKLKLLNRSFQCMFEAQSPGRITASAFNSWLGQVVTTSPGKILVTCW